MQYSDDNREHFEQLRLQKKVPYQAPTPASSSGKPGREAAPTPYIPGLIDKCINFPSTLSLLKMRF